MSIAELRKQLHEYIDTADEKHLSAIYVLLGDSALPTANEVYDEATMKMLYERRNKHRNGSSASFTASESLSMARAHKK